MMLTQKIAIALVSWTVIILVLLEKAEIELFGILILIGILITRELSSTYVDDTTADRMDIFIYIGIIFFIAVVAGRILEILGFL